MLKWKPGTFSLCAMCHKAIWLIEDDTVFQDWIWAHFVDSDHVAYPPFSRTLIEAALARALQESSWRPSMDGASDHDTVGLFQQQTPHELYDGFQSVDELKSKVAELWETLNESS